MARRCMHDWHHPGSQVALPLLKPLVFIPASNTLVQCRPAVALSAVLMNGDGRSTARLMIVSHAERNHWRGYLESM